MGHVMNGAIIATLVDIVSGVTGVPNDEVSTDQSLRDGLLIDSLGMLDVVLAVESRLRVRISDAQMGRFVGGSIADAATWIVAQRGHRPSVDDDSGQS